MIAPFAKVVRALVKEMIMSTTDKALCFVYKEGGGISRILKF